MPDLESMTPGQILADASVADFISSLGLGIAAAQTALDANSVNQLPEFVKEIPSLGGKSLLELGLSPAFYHYQHADLTCSLQLTLKVGTNLTVGVGLNGSYGAGGTSTATDSASEEENESGTSTSTTERRAELTVRSDSTGSLAVGGRSFALTGPDALARIRALRESVTADTAAGVPRVLYAAPRDTFAIATDAPAGRVATTDRTVAFIGAGFARGLIRIDTNADTSYRLDDALTVTTTAQSDLDAYAAHVATRIQENSGYQATASSLTASLARVFFRTGRHEIEQFTAEGEPRNDGIRTTLEGLARLSLATGLGLRVTGHADRQPYPGGDAVSHASNLALSEHRAQEVEDALIAYGAPAANITSAGNGVAGAPADGAADQVRWRSVDITFEPPFRCVLVRAMADTASLSGVTPDNLTPPLTTGNAWIHLFAPQPLSLSGSTVTIDGTDFALSGSPGGGAASGSSEAYAHNLAALITASTTAEFTASADANVVTVYRKSSPFTLTLFTAESRELTLSGSEGVTVTEQFTRTRSSSSENAETSNSTVAFGGTVDVRYARQYEATVTGNSTISARLVSIPAPPQFLDAIRDYLEPDA